MSKQLGADGFSLLLVVFEGPIRHRPLNILTGE
jgi:hypothetical protein